MNCRSRIIFFLIACCMAFTNVWAQSNKEINSLKSQRAKLQKKITQNEGMLKSLKKDVRSQLSNLNVLNGQISTQKKYIDARNLYLRNRAGRNYGDEKADIICRLPVEGSITGYENKIAENKKAMEFAYKEFIIALDEAILKYKKDNGLIE